jgi:hypothetical protein
VVLGLELRTYTFSHSISPVFVVGFFEIGSHELFLSDWLRTAILLISAS